MESIYSFDGDDTQPLPDHIRLVSDGFPDGGRCGELTGPLTLDTISQPWTGASVQLTLFRPGDTTFVGGLQADDEIALQSPERPYGDCIDMRRRLLLPPGATHLIFAIDPMRTTQGNRNFDFSQLRFFELNLGATPDNPVYLRHLRLCPQADTVGAPATPVPGDTVFHLQHQDIACYTYQLDQAPTPPEIGALEKDLQTALDRLDGAIRQAQLAGRQTLYHEAGRLAAAIALEARALYPWTRHPAQRRADLQMALDIAQTHYQNLDLYARGIVHEDDEDDSNIPLPTVPDFPAYQHLAIEGNRFADGNGHPTLLYAMNYHSDGPLCRFFAPAAHRIESYAVGGGSRYDIEWSPVYRALHQHADTRRVGFRGWCGHLIKDQWAMGGRKENVVICLESQAVRQAISQYNRQHQHEWQQQPNLLYNILAYELMYICYCDKSVQLFRGWLEEEYRGDITAVNQAWGTQLAGFDQIEPPPAPEGTPPEETSRGLWYDWTRWNAHRFTDILVWARDDIRQIDARVPLCAGGTHSMLSSNNGNTGIDEEQIIERVDDVILHEGNDLLSLDLLRALADRPKPVVDPEHGGSAYQMLAGFLHGKSAIAKFWWPKQPSRQYPHMTLGAPLQGTVPIDEVAEHVRVALDVRRLGREIALFWELPAEVAIHYSRTCMLQVPFGLLGAHTTPFLQNLRQVYDGARRLDTPVTFISEKHLLADRAESFKILVLPAVRYMPEAVFARLDAYLRQGGHLVVLPESLLADQYARPQNYLAQWGLKIGAVEVPSIAGLEAAQQGYDQSFSQTVRFGPGRSMRADVIDNDFFGGQVEVETEGFFQEITGHSGQVLAGDQGQPLILRQPVGQGFLYYFAGTPTAATLRMFVDALMEQTQIYRPFRLSDLEGRRLPTVEARLVHTKYFDLIYLINEGNEAVEFRLETERPYTRVREMRSLEYWDKPEGVLPGRQTLLFKLMADPVDIGRRREEPIYPYCGY
ncbi:MAG: hypothetical protein GKR89_33720 [Candidatus Latescibacteria bacterium]|nr:hypothetical protein [Candidatus Latescibacterota bacterium]